MPSSRELDETGDLSTSKDHHGIEMAVLVGDAPKNKKTSKIKSPESSNSDEDFSGDESEEKESEEEEDENEGDESLELDNETIDQVITSLNDDEEAEMEKDLED